MSPTVAQHAEANPIDGHTNPAPGEYNYLADHPPMLQHQNPPLPHPAMGSYGYPTATAQYSMQQTVYAAAPQAPPHPPPRHHYHHTEPQMYYYYGSWPVAVPAPAPPMSQHPHAVQYQQPYHTILPQYGSQELGSFDAESEHLASTLHFVRRNPKATLFDIDGKL